MHYPTSAAYSPFTYWILILSWVVQVGIVSVAMISIGVIISVAHAATYRVPPLDIAEVAVGSIILLMLCLEIVMHTHNDLTPTILLLFGIIKLTLWLFPLSVDIWAIVMSHRNEIPLAYSAIEIAIDGVVLIAILLSTTYAASVRKQYKSQIMDVTDVKIYMMTPAYP